MSYAKMFKAIKTVRANDAGESEYADAFRKEQNSAKAYRESLEAYRAASDKSKKATTVMIKAQQEWEDDRKYLKSLSRS